MNCECAHHDRDCTWPIVDGETGKTKRKWIVCSNAKRIAASNVSMRITNRSELKPFHVLRHFESIPLIPYATHTKQKPSAVRDSRCDNGPSREYGAESAPFYGFPIMIDTYFIDFLRWRMVCCATRARHSPVADSDSLRLCTSESNRSAAANHLLHHWNVLVIVGGINGVFLLYRCDFYLEFWFFRATPWIVLAQQNRFDRVTVEWNGMHTQTPRRS